MALGLLETEKDLSLHNRKLRHCFTFNVEFWKIFSDGEREQLFDSRIIMAVHFLHIILDGDILKGRPVGSTVE